MQVIFGPEHFNPHLTGKPGSYEWWYFDFIDNKNEYSAVIIFLTGNPFSPEYNISVNKNASDSTSKKPNPLDFSALSVNIYLKQRVVYRTLFEFSKDSFSVIDDDNFTKIEIDHSSIILDKKTGVYNIDINYNSGKFGEKLRAEMTFKPLIDLKDQLKIDEGKSKYLHYWMPSSPVCDAELKIVSYKGDRRKKIELAGFGYSDHNWGFEPMFKGIDDWYWGRVTSNDYCLIYYYVAYDETSSEKFSTILLFEKNKLIYSNFDFPFEIRNSRNYWLLKYGGTVMGNSEDLSFKCSSDELIDNGPFYVRALAEFDVQFKGKKIIQKGIGFSEYISPKRLKSSFLKNFVNLRIKRIS